MSNTEDIWWPDLDKFTPQLRDAMQRITHHKKPALLIDNEGWAELHRILATHERRAYETEAIEAVNSRLNRKYRKAVECTVLHRLEQARAGLEKSMKIEAVSHRIERAAGETSVSQLIDQAMRIVECALNSERPRPESSFADGAVGQLEENLRHWWKARSRAATGGGRAGNADASHPAYQQFLGLCYSVLSKPPGHGYDALREHRRQLDNSRQLKKQFWKQFGDRLSAALKVNREG
jgi:uncharacterized protein (DUF2267 family)